MVPATSWEMNSFSLFYFLLLAYLHQSGKRSPSTSPYLIQPFFFYQQSKLLLNSYGLKSFSFCGPKLRNELSSELRAIESVFLRLSWEHIFLRHILINPHKFIPPPWYGRAGGGGIGGKDRTAHESFWYVAVFRKDFPVESFWSSQQDEIYFVGGGATGDLWRHQQWSPSWPLFLILPWIKNQVKTAKNDLCLCLTYKITHN